MVEMLVLCCAGQIQSCFYKLIPQSKGQVLSDRSDSLGGGPSDSYSLKQANLEVWRRKNKCVRLHVGISAGGTDGRQRACLARDIGDIVHPGCFTLITVIIIIIISTHCDLHVQSQCNYVSQISKALSLCGRETQLLTHFRLQLLKQQIQDGLNVTRRFLSHQL